VSTKLLGGRRVRVILKQFPGWAREGRKENGAEFPRRKEKIFAYGPRVHGRKS
jgi:hypothetical protein